MLSGVGLEVAAGKPAAWARLSHHEDLLDLEALVGIQAPLVGGGASKPGHVTCTTASVV